MTKTEPLERCAQCRQFTRTLNAGKDMCGAWQQPTLATKIACEFFIAKKSKPIAKWSNRR